MSGAILSPCKYYRYRLWRDVPDGITGRGVFVMLNPSSASADCDDPTIRRCRGFAAGFGWTRFDVVNLYSYRTHNPERLRVVKPMGPDHMKHVVETIHEADLVVCAWGAHPLAVSAAGQMLALIRNLEKTPLCLGTTATGHPRHPLYLPKDTDLEVLP